MIDTLNVRKYKSLDADFVEEACWNDQLNDYKKLDKTFNKKMWSIRLENGAVVKCKYIPVDSWGNPNFSAEFSLSKLLYGNNAIGITDLGAAIHQANTILNGLSFFPQMNLWEMTVRELHLTNDVYVGEDIKYYLEAISKLSMSHRQPTIYYRLSSIYFRSHNKTLVIYDKYDECHLEMARGILRIEDRMKKVAVENFFHDMEPILANINRKMIYEEIERELERLGVLNKSIATKNTALRLLVDKYQRAKGLKYYAIWRAFNDYPDKNTLASDLGLTVRSVERQLKNITSAGIPLIYTESNKPLPPLMLNKIDRKPSFTKLVPVKLGYGLRYVDYVRPINTRVNQQGRQNR